MTDDEVRQRLRAYALEDVLLRVPTDPEMIMPIGERGAMAGKAFMALQNVLDLLPEIEEKNGVPHVAGKVRDAIARAFETTNEGK